MFATLGIHVSHAASKKLLCVTLTAAMAGHAGWSIASAASNPACQWYVQTSAKQQQENLQKACGFKGSEWTTDVRTLGDFCDKQAPDMWKSVAQKRQQMLDSCKKK